jgi:GntR family transcriptional regulator/MocR family aminotransferase
MNPHSRRPLHRQVFDFLRRAIAAGDLPAGSALPSTRSLARRWRVSRNTIVTAYEELTAEGLIVSRTGSATRVLGAMAIPRLPDPRLILRESHYPAGALSFRDSEGNLLYMHR